MFPQTSRSAGAHEIESAGPELRDDRGLLRRALGNSRVLTGLAFALVAVLSIHNHFIQDDGFITLRYVDNFLRGHGPVWYPGSDEFGYTNFLFMLLVAGISLAGIDPVVSANIVSYAGFFVSVVVAYLIARRLTSGNGMVAAIAIAVSFSNFTVSSYASGLLETSLQLAFVLLTYHFALAAFDPPGGVRNIHLATAAATLGLLTRLDTVLLIAPAFLYLFYRIWTAEEGRRRWIMHMAVALAGAALVMSAFLAFCFVFYGQALPNTFYAKSGLNLRFGAYYLVNFLISELLLYPSLLAVVVVHFHHTERRLPRLGDIGAFRLAMVAAALIWVAYVLYVGGGFMGFRLMIPFIVLFLLLAFVAMGRRFGIAFMAQMAVFAMLVQCGQYLWFSRADVSAENLIETPVVLDRHLTRPGLNWQILGQRLNTLFYTGSSDDVTIGLTAAGMIAYESRLPAFDIHGLNTREVARNGEVVSDRPGHRKQASVEQMLEGGVNLIVTTRYVCHRDAGTLPHEDLPWHRFWPDLPAVLIPMPDDGCWTVSFYVQPHPDIEDHIGRGTLILIPTA